MSIMMLIMMIIAGMAISLAIYFLLSGIFSYEPQLNASMVQEIGVPLSVIVFALCGPVLVLKLCFADDGEYGEETSITGVITTGFVSIFWSGVLGVVATHSVQAALEPALTQL